MFYVYEWYIKETGEIIYVGKGSKKRYLCKKHNYMFNNFIKRYNCESRIIEYFENEQEAYLKEFERIEELKMKNQCVCNLRQGGNGGGASINHNMVRWTTEERIKYSINNVMKDEKQRTRMSINNPMKNKEYSEKQAIKKRKTIILKGKEYYGWKSIAKEYGVTKNTVGYWLKTGKTNKGEGIKYKQGNQQPSIGLND